MKLFLSEPLGRTLYKMLCLSYSFMANYWLNLHERSGIKVMKNSEMDLNLVSLGTGCDFCGECIEWCMPQAIAFVNFDEVNPDTDPLGPQNKMSKQKGISLCSV